MAKGYGTFLGVSQEWYTAFRIDETALKEVYAAIRVEAQSAGCHRYPGRDDIASSDVLFRDVVRRYELKTGVTIPTANYSHFRRWILLLFKGGDMP